MIKHTCKKFSSETISRFIDLELSENEQREIRQHLNECQVCTETAEKFSSLSRIFSRHAENQVAMLDATTIKTALDHEIYKKDKNIFASALDFMGKHLYLKLATLAAILLISIMSLQNLIPPQNSPSAIVKSVDTDFASVMIIETQKEKHTIIWFSET